jgi:hypothetical protein
LIKGGEVGKVEKLTRADRMLDQMLDLCVQSMVVKWLGLGLLTRR